MSIQTEYRHKLSRKEIIAGLLLRDGNFCMYPKCGHELDHDAVGNKEVTIDHFIPQSWAIANGWTQEEIWDLDNLKLMERSCNAKKGDLLPNKDGSIPPKPQSRSDIRANKSKRVEVCITCQSGRLLGPDDVCRVCDSGPMPFTFPRWAKMSPKDCPHSGPFWCWMESLYPELREPAIVEVLNGYEFDAA